MSATFFVDTNVLVYSRDSSEKKKQPLAQAWLAELWPRRAGRLSTQVLAEYYVTVTRKLKPGLDPSAARQDVRDLLAWNPVGTDAMIFEKAWQLQDRFCLSFWDTLIIAAALRANAEFLLTEDLQDGLKIDEIKVVDPFAHPVADYF